MPNLAIIAGPNGAGKTSSAPLLINERLGIAEFVNADVIAAELSPSAPDAVAIQAGRIMLKRLDALAEAGADFAFETTLASRHFAPWIARLQRERGYRFHLFYLWLPNADLAIKRVAWRVTHGGHAVPPDVIRQRYDLGLRNFFELFSPIADFWEMHENAVRPPKLIAAREGNTPIQFGNRELWEAIQKRMSAREKEPEYAAGPEPKVMGVPISEVMAVFDQAGREAYARHKALGIPVVIWRDGQVVELPPSEIPD